MKIFSSAVSMLMMAICLLSALCGMSVYAQAADGDGDEYNSMVEEGYEWGYFHARVGDPTWHDQEFYYRVQFLGDSIVDGKTYKKLYMYLTDKLNPDLQRPIALMREENKQVFMYPPDYIFEHRNSEYREEWGSLQFSFSRYACMDNLIYDFNVKNEDVFLNINYPDWFCQKLIHKGTLEFSTGSKTVYYSIGERAENCSYSEKIDRATKTIADVGVLSAGERDGILSFPITEIIPATILDGHYLLYKRKLDGTMVFVNDENAKYMEDDPTVKLSSVEDLSADGGDGVWIEDGTLRGDGLCTVSTLSGVKLYSGVAEGYRFPASGIYLIKTSTRVLKVAVAI